LTSSSGIIAVVTSVKTIESGHPSPAKQSANDVKGGVYIDNKENVDK
jgi:hypothetical protein